MIVSFRHDQQRVTRRRRFLGVLLFVSIVMFIARVPLSHLLGEGLLVVGRPLWVFQEKISGWSENIHTLFSSKLALAGENDRLRSQLDAIIIGSLSRDALRAENDLLKSKLARTPEGSLVLARVLSSPATSPYDTFIIDVGAEHSITEGMEVFGEGDFVIGEVTRVWNGSSVVTLYSAPGATVSASIGTSSIPATAHGVGGGNFRITLPKGLAIAKGDLVEMPSLAPTYLGTVGGVIRPEGSSLQVIFTALPFNIYEQKWVFVSLPAEIDGMTVSRTDRTIP